jgi:predicted RNase H-like nuclease (RuvC/YqgF family)
MTTSENERNLEQTQSENVGLRKTVDELEDLVDSLKKERDEAVDNLESTMREISEIA